VLGDQAASYLYNAFGVEIETMGYIGSPIQYIPGRMWRLTSIDI
jgi:hypothetical protein